MEADTPLEGIRHDPDFGQHMDCDPFNAGYPASAIVGIHSGMTLPGLKLQSLRMWLVGPSWLDRDTMRDPQSVCVVPLSV